MMKKALQIGSGILIGAAALMAYIEVGHNVGDQLIRGQSKFQVNSPSTEVGRKAAINGEVTLAFYNIDFEGYSTRYDSSSLEDYLNKAFESLGININVIYRDFNLNTDEEIKARGFEEFIRETKLDPYESIGNVVEQYLKYTPGIKNYFDADSIEADAIFVVANFKDSPRTGALTNRQQIGLTFDNNYVYIDKHHTGKPISQKDINRFSTHELAHLLGINHSLWPIDVTAVQWISGGLIDKFPELAFSLESKFEWERIKRKYLEECRVPEPKFSGMRGSYKYIGFYNRHGYHKNPPKEIRI